MQHHYAQHFSVDFYAITTINYLDDYVLPLWTPILVVILCRQSSNTAEPWLVSGSEKPNILGETNKKNEKITNYAILFVSTTTTPTLRIKRQVTTDTSHKQHLLLNPCTYELDQGRKNESDQWAKYAASMTLASYCPTRPQHNGERFSNIIFGPMNELGPRVSTIATTEFWVM